MELCVFTGWHYKTKEQEELLSSCSPSTALTSRWY